MAFPHETRTDSFKAANMAGYDGVEPSLEPDAALSNRKELEAIRDAANENSLEIPSVLSSLFWEYPLTSTDDAIRERGIELGTELLYAAAELDATRVLVVPGVVDADTPYDEAYENALDGVRRLAETADNLGVTVAVENVWNDFLYSPLEFRAFIREAAQAGPVGAYFDVGNVRRFGHPEQWLPLLEDELVAVHVKDYVTEIDTIDAFTYPLHGDVDWDAVSGVLDDLAYDDWIIPEVAPYETRPERMLPQVLSNLQAVFEG